MRRDGCREQLLGLLAEMPFLDRQDMAAVSGRSTGTVYETVRKLEATGPRVCDHARIIRDSAHAEVLPDGGGTA